MIGLTAYMVGRNLVMIGLTAYMVGQHLVLLGRSLSKPIKKVAPTIRGQLHHYSKL
jgi:hypothetical protein